MQVSLRRHQTLAVSAVVGIPATLGRDPAQVAVEVATVPAANLGYESWPLTLALNPGAAPSSWRLATATQAAMSSVLRRAGPIDRSSWASGWVARCRP